MHRILIKGAAVVTMDHLIGDLVAGDVLVEGDRIGAIEPDLQLDATAEVIDGTGCIVIPGLINAHMHTWQTGLRGVASNWTLLEYFRWVHAGLATRFRPEDIYIATVVGAMKNFFGLW